MTICGFLVGGVAVIVVPVVAPIAIVIGAIRYFDPPEPKKYDKNNCIYTVHPRGDT
jgi:hypothetical protein